MSKKHEESSGEKVPLWIISFADMITLLLSFFVMLQTMAKTQDAALIGISRESFHRAIAGMGVPDFLFGETGQLDMKYKQLRHSMEEKPTDEINPGRIIDADDEVIRQLFNKIKEEMKTSTSNQPRKVLNVLQAPVKFKSGRHELSPEDKAALDLLVQTLLGNARPRDNQLEVLGWAGDESDPRQQWMLAARRASKVEQYLRVALREAPKGQWEFSSWGVGSGNPKLQSMGFAPGKSAILIVVSTKGE